MKLGMYYVMHIPGIGESQKLEKLKYYLYFNVLYKFSKRITYLLSFVSKQGHCLLETNSMYSSCLLSCRYSTNHVYFPVTYTCFVSPPNLSRALCSQYYLKMVGNICN